MSEKRVSAAERRARLTGASPAEVGTVGDPLPPEAPLVGRPYKIMLTTEHWGASKGSYLVRTPLNRHREAHLDARAQTLLAWLAWAMKPAVGREAGRGP